MAVARSGFVSLDCVDTKPPAEFWAAMLGSKIMFTIATDAVGVRTDGVWLSSIVGADYTPPTWPEAQERPDVRSCLMSAEAITCD